MQLWRVHGLGNDYLVWEGPRLTAAAVRALCHRHTGVGGDGVLEPMSSERADHGVRIHNPDGSIAEKSGNGLRIFSWYLTHQLGAPVEHTVDTGFDVVRCQVDGLRVRVEMGSATFSPARVPVLAAAEVVEETWSVCGAKVLVSVLSVGNPHCVCFVATPLDELPWREWGAALERDGRFPNRTNVQVARVSGERAVDIRIWERGAGETMASGSSSCAVAAAAVRTGRLLPGPITVNMPGGTLDVEVQSSLSLVLTGPVEPVGRVLLEPGWWAAHVG